MSTFWPEQQKKGDRFASMAFLFHFQFIYAVFVMFLSIISPLFFFKKGVWLFECGYGCGRISCTGLMLVGLSLDRVLGLVRPEFILDLSNILN
jgi:hypothetical protein